MIEEFERTKKLERELHLRQLQVRRLLQMTQAINNNVAAEDLFGMYRGFLRNELGVHRMALFVRDDVDDNQWNLATNIGLGGIDVPTEDMGATLSAYTRSGLLQGKSHPFLHNFVHIVPVLHKERPIAYILVGTFEEDEDMFERIQIITTITNVIAVAIENKRLFRRQIEQERLEADLDLGAKVQQMLIPASFPVREEYEISTIYKPKLGVGGDYLDYTEFEDEDTLVFCIGDFTGKGVSAALLMANFQANFHTLINKRRNLYDFVREINSAVYRITNGERFVTFFVAEYNRKDNTLSYVNAGHPPAILVSENGIQLLDKGTLVLGSIDELPMLEVGKVQLPQQSLIVTYTDGLTDLQNPAGETLEEPLLHDFCRRQHGLSAKNFNDRLRRWLDEFRQGTEYPDDLTVLTCRIFHDS
ncbi:PP2C family protein-serine/threonine phosphatase [Neolewinella antarctica]|uniref:Sigma-B regulation protein RsbU (Phosphoserine phosphatase) n=1 Tax=Neolewinella antarctica TaxID=442734 RepID=A0ABX0XHJ6_9BACT|nr:SpoIIE family protein phosphatase [Neolewinella antarctica]NJC28248.1 sigma-B regulation protein RsbU (phosphoserine phosphatase) [Neolewinella antarctica]